MSRPSTLSAEGNTGPMFRLLQDAELNRQLHQDVVFVIRRQDCITGVLRSSRGLLEQRSVAAANLDPRRDPSVVQESIPAYGSLESNTGAADRQRVDTAVEHSSGLQTAPVDIRVDGDQSEFYRQNSYNYDTTEMQSSVSGSDALTLGYSDTNVRVSGANGPNTFINGSESLFSFDM